MEMRSAGDKRCAAVGEWAKGPDERIAIDETPEELLQIDRLRTEIKLMDGCHLRQISLVGRIAAGLVDRQYLLLGKTKIRTCTYTPRTRRGLRANVLFFNMLNGGCKARPERFSAMLDERTENSIHLSVQYTTNLFKFDLFEPRAEGDARREWPESNRERRRRPRFPKRHRRRVRRRIGDARAAPACRAKSPASRARSRATRRR